MGVRWTPGAFEDVGALALVAGWFVVPASGNAILGIYLATKDVPSAFVGEKARRFTRGLGLRRSRSG